LVLRRKKFHGTRENFYDEELPGLFFSPNLVIVASSRKMRQAHHIIHMRENINVHRVLVGKTEKKKPLRKPGLRWKKVLK
jgi:tRNA pseudouridine-54 N-methylase